MHLLTIVNVNIEKCVASVGEQYTADCFPSPLQVPGHLDEGRCLLQIYTVSTYFLYTIFN